MARFRDVPRTKPLPLETIMRLNHERDCHNEPRFESISSNHYYVHETDAMRERSRRVAISQQDTDRAGGRG